jgi:inosose dehydratase
MVRIGHTGITWGIPGDVEQAYRETAELGYLGFETFGRTVLEWNAQRGGFRQLVDRYGIPLAAVYCTGEWIDPSRREQEIAEALAAARALGELGGQTLVVQAGRRPPGGYGPEQFAALAAALNELGQRVSELGIRVGLHPHTGTAVETRADIDTILALLDPRWVGFAPDTGQIAKGGSDILAVLRTYRDRIVHVHLKDWSGKVAYDADGKEIDATGYVNYTPIGQGILPMPAILDLLLADDFAGWINVELDGTPRAPRPPREAAALSRRYLGEILGDRVAWRR